MKKIFIIGCPRSGTSITGRLLGSCTNTMYWEESDVINSLSGDSPFSNQEDVDRFLKYMSMTFGMEPKDMPNPKYNLFHSSLEAGLTISKNLIYFQKLRGKELVDTLLKYSWEKLNKRSWIEKTPSHTFKTNFIKKIYPDSTILHVCRHPLDVLSSVKEWSIKQHEEWCVKSACELWNDYFGQASMNSDLSVRYTDITFHKLIIQQLAEKLELQWNNNCDSLYGKVFDGHVGAWDKRLNRKEIWTAFKLINWEIAKRAGFFPY